MQPVLFTESISVTQRLLVVLLVCLPAYYYVFYLGDVSVEVSLSVPTITIETNCSSEMPILRPVSSPLSASHELSTGPITLDDSQYTTFVELFDFLEQDDFFLLNTTCSGTSCSIQDPCSSCSPPDITLLGVQKGGTSNLVSAMHLHPSRYKLQRHNVAKDKTFLPRNIPKSSLEGSDCWKRS
eukprot:TRINITY_DN2049_c0_g1_i2.p1 TRINITY_DN2049_c0_g1~~TRINITY_DN2049_c0_g1_i2.p1  ORF type:complete len:183 (-),score=14.06 TRINITY_DN2049_c0_g1_i2:584-1132(-)